MTRALGQASHPVSAARAEPYGHPRHPIPVTAALGARVPSLVFDMAMHPWPSRCRASCGWTRSRAKSAQTGGMRREDL